MGPKVPFMKDGVLNLLRVADLTAEEKHQLVTLGYGDMLHHQSPALTAGGVREDGTVDGIDLHLEKVDPKRASTITFSFVSFTTSLHANPATLPKRIYI